jgi:DNA-binding response OmpR family regulator
MTLERAEFSVDTFNDPSAALKSFKPNLYDLVVLDILMPNLDGFELYKQLKKLDPDIRICFLTACEIYHEENGKEKQCNLDKNLFLQMPMPLKKIVEEINKRLDSR